MGLKNINESVYNDLAWGGLDFEDSTSLTEADKEHIEYRLSAEQLNTAFDAQIPAGIKIIRN